MRARTPHWTGERVEYQGPAGGVFVFEPWGEWTRGDLNPRPLLCESSDLPLIYVPGETATPLGR